MVVHHDGLVKIVQEKQVKKERKKEKLNFLKKTSQTVRNAQLVYEESFPKSCRKQTQKMRYHSTGQSIE